MNILILEHVNLDNPIFESLEIHYQQADQTNKMNNKNELPDKGPKYNLKGIQAHRSCTQILLDSSLSFKSTNTGDLPLLAIKKLFVTNLSVTVTVDELIEIFKTHGEVSECVIKKNKKSNYAFVTYTKVNCAIKALKNVHGKSVHGKNLTVIPADPRHQPYPKKPPNDIDEPKITNQTDNSNSSGEFYPLVHKISDTCLMHIFQYLSIADRIKVERVCRRWRDLSLDSWRSLRRLDVNSVSWGCKSGKIETTDLYQILKRCGRYITTITFFEKHRMMPLRTLFIIGKYCPNLKIVYLGTLEVTPREIDYLLSQSPNIEFLEFDSFHFRDRDFQRIFEKSDKLTFINFDETKVDGSCFTHLPEDVETFAFCEPKKRTEFYAFEFVVQKLKKLENLYLNFSSNSEGNEDSDDYFDEYLDENDDFQDDDDDDDDNHDDDYLFQDLDDDYDNNDDIQDDVYDNNDDDLNDDFQDDVYEDDDLNDDNDDYQDLNDGCYSTDDAEDLDIFEDEDEGGNSNSETSDNRLLTFKTPDEQILNSPMSNEENSPDKDEDEEDYEDYNDVSSTITDIIEQKEINSDETEIDNLQNSTKNETNDDNQINAAKLFEDQSSTSKTSESQSLKTSEEQSSISKISENQTKSTSEVSISKSLENQASTSKSDNENSTFNNEASTSKECEKESKEKENEKKENYKIDDDDYFDYGIDFDVDDDYDDYDYYDGYDDYDNYDDYDDYDDYGDHDDFDGFDVEDDFIFESHLAETIRKTLMHCNNKLKILQLKSCSFAGLSSNDLLSKITNFTNLERLDVSDNIIINDEILSAIGANCPKLNVLIINNCGEITDVGIGGIALLPDLKHLSMCDNKSVTGRQLSTLCTLRTLYCARCVSLVEDGLDTLILNCHELEQLDIQYCKLITNSIIDIVSISLENRVNNNVKLKIFARGTSIDVKNVKIENLQLIEIFMEARQDYLDSFIDGKRGTEKTASNDRLKLRDFRGIIFESSTIEEKKED